MKENVEFKVTGFEQAAEVISKTAKAFSELGKAIEQFQTARPTKGVKLKRWLYNLFVNIIFFGLVIFIGEQIKLLTNDVYWFWFYGWITCVIYMVLNKMRVV